MSVQKTSFSIAIRELAARIRRGEETKRVSVEELLDYSKGRLSQQEEQSLLESVALNPVAARAILDLRRFPENEPEDAQQALSDEQVMVEWEAMKRRLHEELRPHKSKVGSPQLSESPTRWLRVELPLSLAAVFALVAIGLSLWIGKLHRTIEDLSDPQMNVIVGSLTPNEQLSRGAGSPMAFELAAENEHLLLILNVAAPPRHSDYRVELLGPDESVLWRGAGFRQTPLGNFTLKLPRSLLRSGTYTLVLSGLADGQEELVATYDFAVRSLPSG